jgi:hypothetical protein
MDESARAVFLSYASQDAEAAHRICEALRAAGIEVWFDQSELRGGAQRATRRCARLPTSALRAGPEHRGATPSPMTSAPCMAIEQTRMPH